MRVEKTPRDGEMFPRQYITLFDLSRAIVVLRLGAEPKRMWTDVKGRHRYDVTLCVRADVRAARPVQYRPETVWYRHMKQT